MVSRRDRFGDLPAEILDMILGFLPIVEAARMAVLSTFWRDLWLNLSKLCFDEDFFYHIENKYSSLYDKGCIRDQRVIFDNESIDLLVSASFYAISEVLMHHKGHIRKFAFIFYGEGEGSLRSRLFDIDRWLSFVTRKGVEEIHISFEQDDGFLLPNCIFSCPTLKRLHLSSAYYDTVNSPCLLPNFTELCFKAVDFEHDGLRGHKINAPILEDLSFQACGETIFYFNLNAPKLRTLTIQSCSCGESIGYLPLKSSFVGNVRTLVLDPYSIKYFFEPLTRKLQKPCELNVECLKLLDDPLDCDPSKEWEVSGDISRAFIRLLHLFPKLHKLHMHIRVVEVVADCLKRQSELSDELYRVAQTLNSLHALTVSYGPHGWSYSDGSCDKSLCWLEGLLSCFPTLDKFVIGGCRRWGITRKITRKILRFPRASPKVEIVFIK